MGDATPPASYFRNNKPDTPTVRTFEHRKDSAKSTHSDLVFRGLSTVSNATNRNHKKVFTLSLPGLCAPAWWSRSAGLPPSSLSPAALAIAATPEVSVSSTNSDKAPPAFVSSVALKLVEELPGRKLAYGTPLVAPDGLPFSRNNSCHIRRDIQLYRVSKPQQTTRVISVVVEEAPTSQPARHGWREVVAQPLGFLGPCTSEGADRTAVAVAVSLCYFRIGCVEGGHRFL